MTRFKTLTKLYLQLDLTREPAETWVKNESKWSRILIKSQRIMHITNSATLAITYKYLFLSKLVDENSTVSPKFVY